MNKPNSIVAALQPLVDAGSLAGAVTLVGDREKILSLDTVGFADIAGGQPMQPDSMFWVASQTKPINATAVMMLVAEGKIHLDDPISQYLPEFKDQWLAVEQDEQHVLLKKPKRPITIRHLLSHASGMSFTSPMEKPTLDTLCLQDAVRSYAMMPLLWEPGTHYNYSNQGVNTSGRIIEVVTGMAYADFLKQRLLAPLGMKDTTFWPSPRQIARLAKVYKANADKTAYAEATIDCLHYPLNDRRRQPIPGGGLFGTVTDMFRFCRMILNGGTFKGRRYLSESSVKEMTTRQITPDMPDQTYGLGWSVDTDGVFSHGGAYATNMCIESNNNLIKIFHVQHNGFIANGDKAMAEFKKAVQETFGGTGK